jgi:hypothetical protein
MQLASAGSHGSGQQNGCTNPAANVRVKVSWPYLGSLNLPGMVANLFDTYPQTF